VGLTHSIAEEISKTSFNSLPENVVDKVKDLVLDLIGVTLAGVKVAQLPVRVLTDIVCRTGGYPEAALIGRKRKVPCAQAAMVNSLAAAILELGDGDNVIIAHPGQVVIPAALALAEKQEADGKDLIAAIVAGYETMFTIGSIVIPAAMHERGFAPSGILCSFGASAASCKLLDLDVEQTVNAIGLAASAMGFREPWVVTGTMDKDIMICEATRRGLWGAMLAGEGVTGACSILEGSEGFFRAMLGKIPNEQTTGWTDGSYSILNTYLKKYPSCRHTHSTIDATLEVARTNPFSLSDIASLTITVDSLSAKISIGEPDSDTGVRFSHQFAAAIALIKGKATLAEFTADVAREPEVQTIIKKASVKIDPEMDKGWPEKWSSHVEVKLNNGKRFNARVDYPRGDKKNPMEKEEVMEKFKSLSSGILDPVAQDQVTKAVQHLEEVDNIRYLMELV
jgi:2-methylcitrate dehydratase PrpD